MNSMLAEKVYIFGSSQRGVEILHQLRSEYEIVGFVDNDESKWGKTVDGVLVYSPNELILCETKYLVLIASIYHKEIAKQLDALGISNYCNVEEYSQLNFKSILFFGGNSSGSTTCIEVLRALAVGIMNVTCYEDILWNAGKQTSDACKFTEYKPCGYIYPLRSLVHLNENVNINNFRILCMLRDPRDMICSLYFSTKSLHGVQPGKEDEWQEIREELARIDVDTYVMEHAEYIKRTYFDLYQEAISNLGYTDICYASYALMLCDYEEWVKKIAAFLDFEPADIIYKRLFNENLLKAKNRDPRRSPRPGRYERDLKPETISYINDVFKETLEWMDSVEDVLVKETFGSYAK